MALNAIGTQTTTNLVYVLYDNFTINQGAILAVGPGVRVVIGPASSNYGTVTLTDDGILSFANNDTVTLNASTYASTTKILVGSGGLMTASGTTFNASTANNSNGANSTLIDVNAGEIQLSGGTFDLPNLFLDAGSTDTIKLVRFLSSLAINSDAIVHISWNDFTNVGTNGIVASGDPTATINLDNNYWGTTDPTQIAAKIDDHSKNSALPTVSYQPFMTAKPVQTVAAPVITPYNPGAQNVTLSATLTSPSGTVSEGTVTFTILGTAVQGTVSAGKASATYTVPAGQTAGAYTIAVSYSDPAGNFIDVSDVGSALTIAQVQTSTALSSSATSTNFGSPVTFTATVTVPPPGAGTPTGTVAFKDGSTVLGSSTLQMVNGVDEATFTTSSLPAGSDAITAVYSGDSNFLTSTSSVVNQTVLPVYVVTSTADDGSFGTLRYGINQADAVGSAVTIDFNIGTVGSAQKISLSSRLPALTVSGVYINGLSQGGNSNTKQLITLDGTNAGSGSDGLLLNGTSCTVSGLILSNFSSNGIEVGGSNNVIGGTTAGARNIISGNANDGILLDSTASGVSVQGNYIGGTTALANSGNGIEVQGIGNTIGGTSGARNLISGNSKDGVKIDGGGSGNLVQGNAIGVNTYDSAALANSGNGIEVAGNSNTIGASYAVAPNEISGNTGDGVLLDSGSSGNVVLGNNIGTNHAGLVALANKVGIEDAGSSNTIGGSVLGARNVISGNSGDGVLIDSTASAEAMEGNYIGVNVGGNTALANGSNGVEVQGTGNTIGGNSVANYYVRNFISGNKSDGVLLDSGSSGNQLLGNFIGLGVNCETGVGKVANAIEIAGSSNTIGGTIAGYRNVISGSGNDGVLIDGTGVNNLLEGNYVGTDYTGKKPVANSGNGIEVQGTGNTVGGASGARNLISGNSKDGIKIDGGGSGNLVQGNAIGVNTYDSAALGNSGNGIEVAGNSNTIGASYAVAPNEISGNTSDGVLLDSGSSGNVVLGNNIGTNHAGLVALANKVGIEDAGSSNTIGGSVLGARNVISGNSGDGVLLDSTATKETMQGNYIGVNIGGNTILANGSNGVEVQGTGNTIGGNSVANYYVRNFISGNKSDGVLLDSGSSGNQLLGNFIGLGVSGTNGVGNVANAIEIAGSSNTIGGTIAGYRNVISGSGNDGVLIDGTGANNLLQGNYVGTDYAGKNPVANSGNGVEIAGSDNTVGGTVSGAGNVVSGNSKNGVLVSAGSGNSVSRNSIFANAGLGISLASGANNNIAAPGLSSATISGSTLTVQGSFTAATANVNYVLEFFANPTGDGEGKIYLGSLTVTPTTTGPQSFTFTTTTTVTGANPLITTTLTDAADGTSTFSNGVVS